MAYDGRASGPRIQMALYNDVGGVPKDLVASTPVDVVSVGPTIIPIAPTPLLPGDYWLMAVYDGYEAYIGQDDLLATGHTVHYVSLPFGSPLPDPFPVPSTYDTSMFNYWVVGY